MKFDIKKIDNLTEEHKRKIGLSNKGKVPYNKIFLKDNQIGEIIKLYEKDLMNCKDIGKKFGVSEKRIIKQLNEGGINTTLSHRKKRLYAEGKLKMWNKDKHYRELYGIEKANNLKNKLSKFHIGLKQTKETIEKRVSKLRGIKHTEEARKKMSLAKIGKRRTFETREKMSKSKKEIFKDPEFKKEYLIKNKGIFKKGQISWNYIDGRSKLFGPKRYGDDWDKIRLIVYARDNFKCQHCGILMNDYGSLDIHHKIPFLNSFDNSLNNLITLCRSCHMKEEMKMRKQAILEIKNGI